MSTGIITSIAGTGTRQCGYPHQGKKRGEEKRRKEERKRRRKRISRAHSAIITCL